MECYGKTFAQYFDTFHKLLEKKSSADYLLTNIKFGKMLSLQDMGEI